MRNTSALLILTGVRQHKRLLIPREKPLPQRGRSRDNAVWLPGEREPEKLFLSAVFSPREMNFTGFSVLLLCFTVSRTYAEHHRL